MQNSTVISYVYVANVINESYALIRRVLILQFNYMHDKQQLEHKSLLSVLANRFHCCNSWLASTNAFNN